LWYFLLLLITAESLGFTSYPQAYLSIEASGNNLLIGVNFASVASGYFDATADLYVNNKIKILAFSHIYMTYDMVLCDICY
jgi:hypothetical protein